MDQYSFSGKLEKFQGNLWGYHIVVPESIAEAILESKVKRLIGRYNDSIEVHCALMPTGDGRFFLNINKPLRTKLKLNIGTTFSVTLRPDQSKYGIEISEEFQVLLDQDEEGSAVFHALTPGKQRSLIYLVTKVKNSDKRLEKGNIILEFLKINQGKLDFPALNQAFKDVRK